MDESLNVCYKKIIRIVRNLSAYQVNSRNLYPICNFQLISLNKAETQVEICGYPVVSDHFSYIPFSERRGIQLVMC